MDVPLETQHAAGTERTVEMGPDRVIVTDDLVTIDAKNEMPDWKVRAFKVVPIYFEDKKYYLAEKRKGERPYAIRYVLKPWVEGEFDSAAIFHTYDAETVAQRDSSRRSEAQGEVLRAFLLLLYPFLGLLWSRTQQRLPRLGFVPRTITSISIFTVFCLFFAQGVFLLISLQTSARSGVVVIGGMIRQFSGRDHLQIGSVGIPLNIFDIVISVAMLLDVIVRYAKYLQDDDWSGGFLEWIFRRSARSTE